MSDYVYNPFHLTHAMWREHERKLDRILRELAIIRKQGEIEMADFTKITADVAAQKTVVDSVVALLTGLNSTIADLRNQVSQDTQTQAALDQLQQQIDQNSAALSTAVTANTPVASAPNPQTGVAQPGVGPGV